MKSVLRFVVCMCLVGAIGGQLGARQSAAAPAEDKTPPSYDMKAQAVLDLQQMQDKFTKLADAIPQEKFSWRPGEGVRSISELLLHVAG